MTAPAVDVGVFIPIANNGWLMSEAAPQYKPSFALNKSIVQRAEAMGMDFALSMVKLRGFGGSTEFWDYALESFTLMSALAAVTDRIKLFASVAVLTMPPAIAARMAVTVDSVAPGRFGINIVSGWAKEEYTQMGLWPGAEYFGYRYDYSSEYVQVMRELWENGRSDFAGRHFQMEDCVLLPAPSGRIDIVGAGQSPRGLQFVAEHGDFNFIQALGVNTPRSHEPQIRALRAAAEEAGRPVGAYVLCIVVADETDEAAGDRWQRFESSPDFDALRWMAGQGADDKSATTAKIINVPQGALHLNIGVLVGSFSTVAAMLDDMAGIEGTSGILLIFDDFEAGLDAFGARIQPLMVSRTHISR